jgi:hypothetical protein
MEAREPIQPDCAITWKARLVPLQGPCIAADIVVTHMASRLMTVRSATPVAPAVSVRIDQHDTILVGEVLACREEGPGEYSLLIEMDESLSGLHNLRKLVSALLGEARAGEPRHPLKLQPARRRKQQDRPLEDS